MNQAEQAERVKGAGGGSSELGPRQLSGGGFCGQRRSWQGPLVLEAGRGKPYLLCACWKLMAPVVVQCRKEGTVGPTNNNCPHQFTYPFIHSFIHSFNTYFLPLLNVRHRDSEK